MEKFFFHHYFSPSIDPSPLDGPRAHSTAPSGAADEMREHDPTLDGKQGRAGEGRASLPLSPSPPPLSLLITLAIMLCIVK